MRALFLGRFQPFHNAHLKIIKEIAKNYDVIVVVGSANESHTLKNPFTAGERIEMIRKTLKSENIENFIIIPVWDIHRNALWASHVKAICPKFDVVFANSPLTKILFKQTGYKIIETKEIERETLSATQIRERIIKGKDWKNLVPKSVYSYIKEIDGDKRLRLLYAKKYM